ncbi:MAG: M20 family metallopeptidase [Lachnospiraceae bacterium]
MNITNQNSPFLTEALEDKDLIISDRRYLHSHPGTGFDIPETVSYVTEQLTKMGYEPTPCGKAGVVALAGGKHPGKIFLLRADMDALPVQEQSGVEFASQYAGKMHACGHDMHTAMLLEAARILKRHEDEIVGTIKLMFQPAEEIFQGSHDMICSGVLENPKVDAALMIHVSAGMPFPSGTVVACDGGISAAACDFFDVTVQGKGCHGSMPHQGIDPIISASHMILALQEIHARELSMSDEAVLTVGYFKSGAVNNVIPDTAEFGGSIRTFDEGVRANIKTRLEEIVKATADVYRTSAEVRFSGECPTLCNNPELAACIPGYLREMLGEHGCFTAGQLNAMAGNSKPQKGVGSEDFAFVSQKVPSLMLALAAGTPADGYCYPQHHPMVRFDEDALPIGSAVYVQAAIRYLQEHPLN